MSEGSDIKSVERDRRLTRLTPASTILMAAKLRVYTTIPE
jgi:hypothetical protein